MNKKIILTLRIFINIAGIVAIIFAFSYFIKKDLVLSGYIAINSNFTQKNPMMSVIYPEHRAILENGTYKIQEEPVYFNLRSPIKFDKAKIEIEFKDGGQNLINLGVKTNENIWNFKTHALFNKILNEIPWKSISDEKNTLWQKTTKFDEINDFIPKIKDLKGVNLIDFSQEQDLSQNYIPQNSDNIITDCLRGSHTILTYIKNEPLNFNFKIQDINRSRGKDPVAINVYDSDDKKIYSNIISDDEKNPKEDTGSEPKYISIFLENLKTGVYKIEIITDDDIFVREIKTKQQKIVFSQRLYLCNNREYLKAFPDLSMTPTNIFTNGKIVSFYTAHKTGLQTVSIDGKEINIDKQHKWFEQEIGPKLSTIAISKNNLKVSSIGIFALKESQYFDPDSLDLQNYIDSKNVNYVISQYKKPTTTNDDFKKNVVYFDLKNASIEDGNLKFIISIPEISKEKGFVEIKSIKAELYKDNPISRENSYKNFYTEIENNAKTKFEKLKNKIQVIFDKFI